MFVWALLCMYIVINGLLALPLPAGSRGAELQALRRFALTEFTLGCRRGSILVKWTGGLLKHEKGHCGDGGKGMKLLLTTLGRDGKGVRTNVLR